MNAGFEWVNFSLMALSLLGIAVMAVWLFGKPRDKDRP